MEQKQKQTKSKERVRQHGEVFTAEREVKAMCDLVKDEMAVESLNLLLKKYSYTDCNIEKSSVPLKY